MGDFTTIEAQIGRPLRAESQVVATCPLGLPVVAEVPPILDDGTPFPTTYWLACPLAGIRIGRLESIGGVRRMEAKAKTDPGFAAALEQAHRRYQEYRDSKIPSGTSPRPTGGIAGASAGVKCLHAHYADYAAGNENPVGAAVALWVEPLDCQVPCVIDGVRNVDWVEPR